MPNSLKIRVGVEAGKTDSKFTVVEGGTITLRNDASATLKMEFGSSSPVCLQTLATVGPQQPQLLVELGAGVSRDYKACAVVAEQAFPYMATVAGTQTESATIIVEKPTGLTPETVQPPVKEPSIVIHREMMGENYFFAAAGLLFGVVLCAFIEPRWVPGRNKPRP